MTARLRASVAATFLLVAVGCGTESSPTAGTAPPAQSVAPGAGTGTVTVSFAVPHVASPASSVRRRPKFISPATMSVTAGVDGTNATTASANCTSSVCTVTLALATGSHTLALRLWDAPNGGGNELASNTAAACAVALGTANACTVVMYGTAASLAMTTSSSGVTGSSSTGFTFLNATSNPFTIAALDADGYQIVGVGGLTPSISTTGTGITIATPAPSATPPIYGIGDANAATQTLTIHATPAPGSDGSPLSLIVSVAGETCAQNAITGTAVPMGTAATFAVLGATTVTNAGATVVTGNLGVSPGTAVTGFGPGVVTDGSIHSDDPLATQAQVDAAAAYANANGRSNPIPVAPDLAGLTLTPGVYLAPTSLALTGNVTLDGGNDPNSVFIIQIGTSFGVAGNSTVTLANGADACNVFWAVGTSATFAANASIAGTVLAHGSISLAAGVGIHGRMLAQTGAVTLSSNAVTLPRL
jgi:hypothetical protein